MVDEGSTRKEIKILIYISGSFEFEEIRFYFISIIGFYYICIFVKIKRGCETKTDYQNQAR